MKPQRLYDNKLFSYYIFLLSYLVTNIEAKGNNYIGCFRERSTSARLMQGDYKQFRDTLTPEICIQHCRTKGFAYAGVQFSYECFCSNMRPPFKFSMEENECSAGCAGDKNLICGGGHRMNVYETYEISKNPVESNYIGCIDTSKKRQLVGKSKTFSTITPEICVAFCFRSGYRFAALQNRECFCGDSNNLEDANDCENCEDGDCEDMEYNIVTKDKVDDKECNIKCSNEKYNCGGQLRNSLYKTGITGFSEENALLGCYEDNGGRIISGFEIRFPETNSPKLCYNTCRSLGYKFAGVEAVAECFCGNVKPDKHLQRAEYDCAMPCPGDPDKGCGGWWRLYVYSTKDQI